MNNSRLLCNTFQSSYPLQMDKSPIEKLRLRLKEAIEHSPPTQSAIAEFCDVTVQSVGGWKKTGRISKDNLKRVSQITGYRYLWLLEGVGPKAFTEAEENLNEIAAADKANEKAVNNHSPAAERLVDSLKFALANKRLSDHSIELLNDFINSLVSDQGTPGRESQPNERKTMDNS